MQKSERVIVLGAGPGGLACAHELGSRGIHSIVLERNEYVGGLCRTVQHHGYRFDLGGHRWFTKNEDLHNWFLRVMEGELVEVNRTSRIFHSNRFFHYPISVKDVLRQSSLWEVIRILIGFGWTVLRGAVTSRRPHNMEEGFVSQFGRPLYEMFFQTYSEKVWGRPCAELSADWVAQRSAGLSVTHLVKEAITNAKNSHKSLIDKFVYPRNGYARLPERLAEDVRKYGGDIRTGARVKRIVYHGPRDFEVVYDHQGIEASVQGDAVVSTIPLGYLVGILEPAASDEALTCARSLEFRDLITVTVMLDIPRVSRDSWVYVQDREILFGRFHEPSNWSRALVPDDSHTSLVMECFCSRGDEIWNLSDETIVHRCVSDLSDRLLFTDRKNVIDSVVVRTPNAYPVYDLDYSRKLRVINEALEDYVGLNTVGRGGTFRYNNADHSIEMGLLCGQRLAGLRVDHRDVNTEQEYHEIRGTGEVQRDRFVLGPESSAGSG